MKKIFILQIFLFLTLISYAQSVQYQLDSMVYHAQDSLGNNYRSAKNAYTYNGKGDCIEDFSSYLNSLTGKWTDGSKTQYYYDDRHNDTLSVFSNYNQDTRKWEVLYKQIETYDPMDKRTSWSQYIKDQKTGDFKKTWKWNYVYDDKNRILFEIYQDTIGDVFKNAYRYFYEYTSSAINKYHNSWRDGDWKLTSKEESLLDVNGNIIENSIYYLKTGTDNNPEWDNHSNEKHTYNANHQRVETYRFSWEPKTWLGNDYQWIPTSYIKFTRDPFNNEVVAESAFWNKNTEVYDMQYRTEREYNTDISHENLFMPPSLSNDNLPAPDFQYMLLESKHAGWVNNSWKYYAPNTYYYSPVTITGTELSSEPKSIPAFANPLTDVVTVSGKIEIWDLLGHLVASGEERIHVSGLAKGVYLVKTASGIFKVVKE